MHNPLFNLLGSSLVPELGSDVAAGSSGHVHLVLVFVAAVRTYPDEFAMFVALDLDFSVVAADLTVIALGIELCVHDIVINVFHDCQNRLDVVLHIRHFHIADSSSRGQFLELSLEGQLVEGVDRLCDMYVIAVGNIVLICHARNDAETLLQAFGKLISGGFQRSAVQAEIDVALLSPFGAGVIHVLHNLEGKFFAFRVCVADAHHVTGTLAESRIAEGDGRITAVE